MRLPDLDILGDIDRTFPPLSPRAISLMVRLAGGRHCGDAANTRALARAAGPHDMVRLLDAWEGDLPRLIESIADGETFRGAASYEERVLDERIYLRHLAQGLLREREPASRVVEGWTHEEEQIWQELHAQIERDGYVFEDGKINARAIAPEVDPVYRSELQRLLVSLGFPEVIWARIEASEGRLRAQEYAQAAGDARVALDRCLEEVVRRAIEARPETKGDLEGGEITRWWNCAQYLRRRGFFGREQQLDPTDKKVPAELRLAQGLHDFRARIAPLRRAPGPSARATSAAATKNIPTEAAAR